MKNITTSEELPKELVNRMIAKIIKESEDLIEFLDPSVRKKKIRKMSYDFGFKLAKDMFKHVEITVCDVDHLKKGFSEGLDHVVSENDKGE